MGLRQKESHGYDLSDWENDIQYPQGPFCLPDLPADKTYEELRKILKVFYKPKVLEVAETYCFHHMIQSENESVTEYANKLKCLVVNCNFGQYLTRALRDQFVGGVRSQSTRKKLLSEDRA